MQLRVDTARVISRIPTPSIYSLYLNNIEMHMKGYALSQVCNPGLHLTLLPLGKVKPLWDFGQVI